MAQPSQEILERIEALIQTGKQQESRLLLLEYIKSNPASARAWWLLSQVLLDINQQMDCLVRVLRLDPENALARNRLTTLKVLAAQVPVSAPALVGETGGPPLPGGAVASAVRNDGLEPVSTQDVAAAAASEKQKKKPHWIEIILAVVLAVVVIVGSLFLWNRRQAQIAAENAFHVQETRAIALLLTRVPTSTPSSTPIPTFTQTSTPRATFTRTLDQRFTATQPLSDLFKPEVGYYAPILNWKM